MERRIVPLTRSVDARLVPTGDPVTIPGASFVTLTQALGGAYTVVYQGNMARIDGADADALGFEPEVLTFEPPADGRVSEDQVWEALRSVHDPEIPVNIVDLGLVYACRIDDAVVHVDMTLTAPGCGMGEVLVEDAREKIAVIPTISDVSVELVFDPPWNVGMMTEEARLQTGMM